MAGKLTLHVLDTARGRPAAGMVVRLYREGRLLTETATNGDGRLPAPLLAGDAFVAGAFRLEFHVGDYFKKTGHPDGGKFLDVVPVDFRVNDPSENYHVPLLATPWSYTTYRGS